MDGFDPDAFLASPATSVPPPIDNPSPAPDNGQPAFDPDAFLSAPQNAQSASGAFDPDAFLSAAPSSSGMGAFGRGMLEDALPVAGGALVGVQGAKAGAQLGSKLGEVGGPVGGIVGGLAGGAVGGVAGQDVEDYILNKFGLKQGTGILSDAQTAADEAQHPYARLAGGLTDSLIGFDPTAAASKVARLGSAAILGGQEAATEYMNNGEIDPTKVAMSAGAGAIMGAPRAWAEHPIDALTGAVRSFRPGRPDTAAQTAPAEKAAVDVANDTPNVSQGVATEQPPAAKVDVQMGAQPLSVGSERNLGKTSVPDNAHTSTVPSTPVSSDPIHPDLASVLEEINEEHSPPVAANNAGVDAGATVPPPAADRTGVPEGDVAAGVPPANAGASPAGAGENPAAGLVEAHDAQVKAASQVPRGISESGDDAAEASRLQREAVANVEQRQAAQQHGEAFSDLPPPPSTEQAKSQPTPVTEKPASKVAIKGIQLLQQEMANGSENARALLQAIKANPDRAEEFLRSYVSAKLSKSGTATGETTRQGLPTTRAELGGVQTGGGARAARKAQASQAVRGAFDAASTQPLPGDRSGFVSMAKQIVALARNANGGNDPAAPAKEGGYVPTSKHADFPKYQWYKAARRIADLSTQPENAGTMAAMDRAIQDFSAAHSGALGKGSEAVNVDASIANARKQVPINEQVTQAPAPPEAPITTRDEPLEPLTIKGEPTAKEAAYNKLVDWVNNLRDPDWHVLNDENEGTLHEAVENTRNPDQTMQELQSQLAEAGRPLMRVNVAEPSLNAAKSTLTLPAGKQPTTLADKAKALWGDESGAGPVPHMPQWVVNAYNAVMDRNGTAMEKQIGRELGDKFNRSMGRIDNIKRRLLNYLNTIPIIPADQARLIGRKVQQRSPLTPDEKEWWDHVQPLYDWVNRSYKQWYKRDSTLQAPYNSPFTEWLPRMRAPDATPKPGSIEWFKGLLHAQKESWQRSFSDTASSKMERDYFAFRDHATGDLKAIFKMDPANDQVEIWKPGSKKPVITSAGTFTGKLKETITGPKKGTQYIVDHALPEEIMRSVPGTNYEEHPVVTLLNAAQGLQTSIVRDKLIEQFKSDNRIQNQSTTDKDEARRRGYDMHPTRLTEMATTKTGKPIYYAKPIKWRLDDFARPGLDYDLDGVRAVAHNLAKPLYFVSPTFHALNVGVQHLASEGGFLARGGLMKAPAMVRGYAGDIYHAWKSVTAQDALQHEITRAGGRLMKQGTIIDGSLMNTALQKLGLASAQKPGILDPIKAATGVDVADGLHHAMQLSNRMMWHANDVFITASYLQARRLGLNPEDAIAAVHNYIGAYRADSPTFGGSRMLQKIANEPAISWFGPYHQDLWQSLGHMAKGLVNPAKPGDRKEAAGAVMALGALMSFVYPYLLDPLAQTITGNKHASLGRRGILAPAQAVADWATGNDTGWPNFMHNVLTPSIPANLAQEGLSNMDWKGHHIVVPNYFTSPGRVGAGAAQLADWALRNTVPPYGNIASTANQKTGWKGIGKKLAEGMVGIKDPSQGSINYNANKNTHIKQEVGRRIAHPEGLIEQFTNPMAR